MISQWFLRFGVLFALAGMSLGIYMGITHDHTLAPGNATDPSASCISPVR
jgi:hypothetical protein